MYSKNERPFKRKMTPQVEYRDGRDKKASTSREDPLSDQEIERLTGISRAEYDKRLHYLADCEKAGVHGDHERDMGAGL